MSIAPDTDLEINGYEVITLGKEPPKDFTLPGDIFSSITTITENVQDNIASGDTNSLAQIYDDNVLNLTSVDGVINVTLDYNTDYPDFTAIGGFGETSRPGHIIIHIGPVLKGQKPRL